MLSPTDISEVQGDLGKMRPTGKNKKFLRRPGRGAAPGGVRVALASKAMMPEGVDVRVTPLVRDAEGDLPEVVSSRIAERAPSSDGDYEVSGDARYWPLLRWRPRPILLGWRQQPTLLGCSQLTLLGCSQPTLLGCSRLTLLGCSRPTLLG